MISDNQIPTAPAPPPPPLPPTNEVRHDVNLLEGAFEELTINNKGAASGFTASKCKVPEIAVSLLLSQFHSCVRN